MEFDLSNIRYMFIDVWDCKASLAYGECKDGVLKTQRLTSEEATKLGITEDMLIDAVEAQGGAINRSGHYEMSDEIREKLDSSTILTLPN